MQGPRPSVVERLGLGRSSAGRSFGGYRDPHAPGPNYNDPYYNPSRGGQWGGYDRFSAGSEQLGPAIMAARNRVDLAKEAELAAKEALRWARQEADAAAKAARAEESELRKLEDEARKIDEEARKFEREAASARDRAAKTEQAAAEDRSKAYEAERLAAVTNRRSSDDYYGVRRPLPPRPTRRNNYDSYSAGRYNTYSARDRAYARGRPLY